MILLIIIVILLFDLSFSFKIIRSRNQANVYNSISSSPTPSSPTPSSSSPTPTPSTPPPSSSSSLITLLNLSQELGKNNNRIREQLLSTLWNSLSQRYDISKKLLSSLSLPLTTIDSNDNLSITAIALKDTIIAQLNNINKKASTIIFYNEPLSNLQELKYPFLFSYDIFDPFDHINDDDNDDNNNNGNIITDEIINEIFDNSLKRSIIDTAIDDDNNEDNYTMRQNSSSDLIKLKMGLRIEARKWRSQADKTFGSLSSSTNNFIRDQVVRLSKDLIDPKDGDVTVQQLIQNSKVSKSQWRLIMDKIDSAKYTNPGLLKYKKAKTKAIPNYALLIHSCLMMSMATYNLELKKNDAVSQALLMLNGNLPDVSDGSEVALEAEKRAETLARNALGTSAFGNSMETRLIVSDKACAIYIYEKTKKLAILVFRGTREPIDVMTDLSFVSSPFTTKEKDSSSATSYKRMEVHGGFLSAFDSIKDEISEIIDTLPSDTKYIITGHSMGGALAQLAAAYFAHLDPWLVSIAAPSIGNNEFCNFVNSKVKPFGGLRVWNEYDAVPYIALLVGYAHAGISLKLKLQTEARELFLAESINTVVASTDVISPHILYQVGQLVHVFPVMGSDLGIKQEDDDYLTNLTLQQTTVENTIDNNIVTKEIDIFRKKQTNDYDLNDEHIHMKIIKRVSSSINILKYRSQDYAYFIAYNDDTNTKNDTNDDDDAILATKMKNLLNKLKLIFKNVT